MISSLRALPAVSCVDFALTHWFPDVVHSFHIQGSNALLMTQFSEMNGQPAPLSGAEYRLGFEVNTRILSYSLPFFTALHFATPREDYLYDYLYGVLLLYALFALGLVFLCMKVLMAGLGQLFLDQHGVFVPNANVIGLLYQFSVLSVPTLAPAIVWLWQSRNTPLLRLAVAGKSGPP